MKTPKPALRTSAQEECGVWLDTVQLKGRAKQKRVARPISKLLNPFAEGGGYSLAVALNFTQTKMEMPKTKQSSISAFFTSQRRVLNKMSIPEVTKMDPMQSSCSSTSTTPTPVSSGTKRRRETDLKKSDVRKSEPDVGHKWFSENVTEPRLAEWQDHVHTIHTPPKDMYSESEDEQLEELNPPQTKKRFTDSSLLAGDSQLLLQAWSQDPLLTCSQFSDSEFYLTKQKNTTAMNVYNHEPSFLNSVQSEEAFGFQVDLEGRTSTQKSYKHFNSSQMDDEKENSKVLPSSSSPTKDSSCSHVDPFSNHKWTKPKTASPHKHITDRLCKRADKEDGYNSQFKWTKPRSSPLKKRAPQVDEDSLATLFTQDSEGFRVIAHRGLQPRSPLKDQTNLGTGMVRTSVYKSLVKEDEEDEILFTQDSQGNMVIKH